jgi:hypothetical protein
LAGNSAGTPVGWEFAEIRRDTRTPTRVDLPPRPGHNPRFARRFLLATRTVTVMRRVRLLLLGGAWSLAALAIYLPLTWLVVRKRT